MEKTKISIIVPMYNVEEYIEKCLESVRQQTYENIELVLINDGSTDQTIEVVQSIVQEIFNVKFICIENQGPAVARNIGLEKATGEYVMFLDSDDYLEPTAVETLFNCAQENHSLLTLGKSLRTDGIKTWEVPSHKKYRVTEKNKLKNILKNPELFYAIGPTAKLFHRSLLEENVFDSTLRFAEDQLFVVKNLLLVDKIAVTSKVVYYYRVRGDSNQSLTQTYHKNATVNLTGILSLIENVYQVIYKQEGYSRDEKEKIYLNYLERLCEIELRVLFKAVYREKAEVQEEFFDAFLKKIEENPILFLSLTDQCYNFQNYLVSELLEFYFLIHSDALHPYYKILEQIKKHQPKMRVEPMLNKILLARGYYLKESKLKIQSAYHYFIKRLGRRST